MKVLHVTPSFHPALVYGGATRSVYNLCVAEADAGCEVSVLTTDANGPSSVLEVPIDIEIKLRKGLRVRYCHRVMDVSVSPSLIRNLFSYVRRVDIVHLMAVYSFPTIPTLLVARMLNKPVVWSTRGMLQRWSGTRRPHFKTVWERLCSLSAPHNFMLHVTSEQERAESATRLPGVRAAMIPNGVYIPDEIVRTAGNGNIRLAYLGRIDPKKGIENLLAACRILLQQANLRFSLEIAGDGLGSYVSSIRALIENYGLSKQVNMLGNVDGEAKKEFFANADLVMVPSHTENFGLVVAEALAHGVPVIASTGTPWRRLEEVGCGLWVNNDPELLAAAIIQIGGMPLDEMGEKGREWMKREYAWPSLADRMIALYESMLIREMAVSSQRFTQTS